MACLDEADLDLALEFTALAIDPAIPYTAAVDAIARRIGEMRKQFSSSLSASPRTDSGALPVPAYSSPGPGREAHEQETKQ